MRGTVSDRSLTSVCIFLLAAVAAPSPAAGQVDGIRPFVGGTLFAETGFHRESWGVGGGVSGGWAISDGWSGQVELEVPTRGTTVETNGTPCLSQAWCGSYYSRAERSRQEVTVSVLFGRHLPPAGRFRATLLLGPAARFERVQQTLEYQVPVYNGAPANRALQREEGHYSQLYPAFVAGFDGEIVVGTHVSVIPQLRLYVTPMGDWEGPATLIRPGVSVRWRF